MRQQSIIPQEIEIYSPPLTSAPSPNPAHPDPSTRRSTRKRKAREDLPDLAADLEVCICGSSAAPKDESEFANMALQK
jgi:hypothetical protein